MFFTTAYAQTASNAAQGSALMNLFPIILIFLIFYLLLIRPQQKKLKAHKEMIHSITRGEKVVTAGGIIGKVTKVEDADNILHVEIAPNVTVKINRPTIADVISRSEPAKEAAKTEKPKAKKNEKVKAKAKTPSKTPAKPKKKTAKK